MGTSTSGKVKPIATFIETLCISHRHADQPWVHLVSLLMPRLTAKFCDLSFENSSTKLPSHNEGAPSVMCPSTTPLRSVHHHLPRALPTFFAPYTDITFAHASDFFKLVGELSRLMTLALCNVAREHDPPDTAVHFPTAPRGARAEDAPRWKLQTTRYDRMRKYHRTSAYMVICAWSVR